MLEHAGYFAEQLSSCRLVRHGTASKLAVAAAAGSATRTRCILQVSTFNMSSDAEQKQVVVFISSISANKEVGKIFQ